MTRPRDGPLGLPNVAWPPEDPMIAQHASSNTLSTFPRCSSTSCCHWNLALAGSVNVLFLGLPLTFHSTPFVRRLTMYAVHVLRIETRNVSCPVSWIELMW